MSDFVNSWAECARAEAYSRLEFPGTYYLAYRDLPSIIATHVRGMRALDFGCGAGRSTRFIRDLGFEAVGIDIAENMIRRAKEIDPDGDYRLVKEGRFDHFDDGAFDLVLSVFTLDNTPTRENKVGIFSEMRRLLAENGRIISLVSSPEIYTHEWASFSTKDFPENLRAKCGDEVRIIVTAIGDVEPVVDIIWPDDSYREVYAAAGLEVVGVYEPLAEGNEPIEWVNETHIAPWVIYVLGKAE